ncbi:MAG TPA: DUF4153 domain-containing protein [Gemmatimonadaceae bacterium]|nr:DUF4153 domain-containing protein [Gemmatimonadaceae bacterium]
MRFPSLSTLAARAREVLARFPYTLLAGVVAAACAIVATTHGASDAWARAALVAALGLPLSFALALLGELHGWSSARLSLAMVAAAALLAGFFFAWPGLDAKHDAIRYFQLSAALHLAVAFLPFVGMREDAGFWQYNRRLFLSFLRAVVFSAVLFAGLSVALAALDKLFGLDVPNDTYLRLWLIIAFVGNTWIFLAGIPDDVAALASDRDYPRALKIFTQYILTPLVAVYLLILLAYLVKIIVTRDWPSGWIGYLVTSVSVAGILGFLLVHPLRDDPGEGWIRTYRRWLFIALIPAAIMLLVAFFKRIAPYGLTELRYLGLLLGVWLLAISILFTVRREHGIRIIPLSLALLLLVTLYGPLGATRRAVASQAARLEREVAAARKAPSPGVVTPAEVQASAALYFLIEHRARAPIAQAFGGTLPGGVVLPDSLRYRSDSLGKAIMTAASLDYSRWGLEGAPRPGFFSYHASENEAVAIRGFAWMAMINMRDSVVAIGSDTLRVAFDSTAQTLTVTGGAGSALSFALAPILDALDSTVAASGPGSFRERVPAGEMRVPATGGSRDGALQLVWVNGQNEKRGRRIDGFTARLLLGEPRD